MNKNRNVQIQKNLIIDNESEVSLHFTYDKNLSLKELSELLDLSNKAINDFNRNNGVKNNAALGKQYQAQVEVVKGGSVIITLLLTTVVPLSLGVLANYLYERIKTLGYKQRKESTEVQPCKYPIVIVVNDNNIEIHISNNN